MKNYRLRKKDKVVNNLIFVVIVVVVLVAKFLPGVVHYWQSSEVYKLYSRVEWVKATYIKDYRLNDTLTVGVTLLEATTDSGWAALQEDFGLPVIPKEYEESFCSDSNKVTIKSFPKSVPLYVEGDTLEDDIIAISHYKHTIAHFVVQSKEQWKLFILKQFEDMERNDIQKYSSHEENN